jgi:hypothetical protein
MDSHASIAGNIHDEGQFSAESLRVREEQSVPPTRDSCAPIDFPFRVGFQLPVLVLTGVSSELAPVVQPAKGRALAVRGGRDENLAFEEENRHVVTSWLTVTLP